MITPIEANARRLIGALAKFPDGATCEDLRRRFEKSTHLARQSFYNALRHAKQKHWLVTDGNVYKLNPDNSWREPEQSIGEQLERAKREASRLGHVADLQTEQIEELRGEVESLRDLASGTNGVAVSNLVRIVADSNASPRQRLKAAGVVLGYRVQDPGISEFVKRYLETMCESADNIDYRIEAGELLRRAQGDTMLRPAIEKLTPVALPVDPVKEDEERRIEFERKKRHLEEQLIKDRARMAEERQRFASERSSHRLPSSD
jgi:hypothetical protein